MSFSRVHRTQRWRKLALQTIREEPICRLDLPGCTRWSETADHIEPVSVRPDLAYERSNTVGACRRCNSSRGNTPWGQLPQLRAAMLAIPDRKQGRKQGCCSFFDTSRRSRVACDQPIVTLGA